MGDPLGPVHGHQPPSHHEFQGGEAKGPQIERQTPLDGQRLEGTPLRDRKAAVASVGASQMPRGDQEEYQPESFDRAARNLESSVQNESSSSSTEKKSSWRKRASPLGGKTKTAFFAVGGLAAIAACCVMCFVPGAALAAYPFFLMGMMAHMYSYFDCDDPSMNNNNSQSQQNRANDPTDPRNRNLDDPTNINNQKGRFQAVPQAVDFSGKNPSWGQPVPPPAPGFNGLTPQHLYNTATGMGLPGQPVNNMMNGMYNHLQGGGNPFDPRAAMALAQQYTPPQMIMGLAQQYQAFQNAIMQQYLAFQSAFAQAQQAMLFGAAPNISGSQGPIVINNYNNANPEVQGGGAVPGGANPEGTKKTKKVTVRVKLGTILDQIRDAAVKEGVDPKAFDDLDKKLPKENPGADAGGDEPKKEPPSPPPPPETNKSAGMARGSRFSGKPGHHPAVINVDKLPKYDAKSTALLEGRVTDWDHFVSHGKKKIGNEDKDKEEKLKAISKIDFFRSLVNAKLNSPGEIYQSWVDSFDNRKNYGDGLKYFEDHSRKYFCDLLDSVLYEKYASAIQKGDKFDIDFSGVLENMIKKIDEGAKSNEKYPCSDKNVERMLKHWVAYLACDPVVNQDLRVESKEKVGHFLNNYQNVYNQEWYKKIASDEVYEQGFEWPLVNEIENKDRREVVKKEIKAAEDMLSREKDKRKPEQGGQLPVFVVRSPYMFIGNKKDPADKNNRNSEQG